MGNVCRERTRQDLIKDCLCYVISSKRKKAQGWRAAGLRLSNCLLIFFSRPHPLELTLLMTQMFTAGCSHEGYTVTTVYFYCCAAVTPLPLLGLRPFISPRRGEGPGLFIVMLTLTRLHVHHGISECSIYTNSLFIIYHWGLRVPP